MSATEISAIILSGRGQKSQGRNSTKALLTPPNCSISSHILVDEMKYVFCKSYHLYLCLDYLPGFYPWWKQDTQRIVADPRTVVTN